MFYVLSHIDLMRAQQNPAQLHNSIYTDFKPLTTGPDYIRFFYFL